MSASTSRFKFVVFVFKTASTFDTESGLQVAVSAIQKTANSFLMFEQNKRGATDTHQHPKSIHILSYRHNTSTHQLNTNTTIHQHTNTSTYQRSNPSTFHHKQHTRHQIQRIKTSHDNQLHCGHVQAFSKTPELCENQSIY
jgi:hypothetical protein